MHWAGIDLSKPVVMGILNVTPDSFSDGGDFIEVAQAVQQAEKICAAGAKILDIGGESTRPNAGLVEIETEIKRVVPVIEAVRAITQKHHVKISIDTRRTAVMHAAMNAGADIINDVSGLAFDPDAVALVAQHQWPVMIGHMRGTPQTMHEFAQYQSVAEDVANELAAQIDICLKAGLAKDKICIDPGIGFAKNAQQNIELLKNLRELIKLNVPITVGVSRKRFIGEITGEQDAKQRLPGSLVYGLYAVQQGANILRVHDVGETVQALKAWESLAA